MHVYTQVLVQRQRAGDQKKERASHGNETAFSRMFGPDGWGRSTYSQRISTCMLIRSFVIALQSGYHDIRDFVFVLDAKIQGTGMKLRLSLLLTF